VSYRQALNEALADALASDDRVAFFGQDVGVFGGAYKASVGLQERFGKDRVVDTPIAELGVCEILAGAAVCGMKPIFEVMFGDFLSLSSDAIVNHAAKFYFASGGKVRVPLIVRAPYGPGNGFGATHSQAVERWFVHVPGLIVAVPSTPADVKQMLLGALQCGHPVLLLEPIGLYANTGPVPEVVEPALTGARVVAGGSRVTVVSYGRALFAALAAREKFSDPNQIEVIDLRCLLPLDRDTLIESARKTGALLVVEDDPKTFGIGGEIVASVVEAGVPLRQVCRLAGADVPIGFSATLEGAAFPNTQQIADALRQFL
jgi:pyruvate/2-oxoglutarate/acetoin dehydrogenase E1 component